MNTVNPKVFQCFRRETSFQYLHDLIRNEDSLQKGGEESEWKWIDSDYLWEVGSLHTTNSCGEDDKVDWPQVASLQTQPQHLPGADQVSISECLPRSPHQPGVEDGEKQGPPLLLRHHRAGDVEVGELGEAGTEDVGVHPGEAHRVKGE